MKMLLILRHLQVCAAVLLMLCGAAGAADGEPRFELPLDCEVARTCFVQNYVDHDPGPGRVDFHCGRLTYDGHQGTDIRLLDEVEMRRGYRVLAAADGVVRATRDGMPDVTLSRGGEAAIQGREAGNSVVIDHGNGWTTQYSHMQRGSVAVRQGESVQAGQTLGLVGLSGRTEFPHLEFVVRHDGTTIDPFVGVNGAGSCGKAAATMWTPSVSRELTYRPTGLLRSFFADSVPNSELARQGSFRLDAQAQDPPALVLWVDVFGLLSGDEETFAIKGPDGRALLDERKIRDESKVSWFSYAGIRRPRAGWLPGVHRGEYRLLRQGEVVARADVQVDLTR